MFPSFLPLGATMYLHKLGALFIILTFLVSCSRLSVRTEKIDHKHLASYHVETPDPVRCRFFKGQQVVISWRFCKHQAILPFRLKLFLIRANHSLEVLERDLCCYSGTSIFYFLGEDWCTKGEILTWRAEIYSAGKLLATHHQSPWVDWIDDSE